MSLLKESKLSLRLAIPLMIGQLGQMLLGVVDTLMVGRLGVTELAALTFANSLFYIPLVFGIGVMTAVSVTTSNAQGAGDRQAARDSCRHGLYVGLALGVILFAIGWILSRKLHWFGQPEHVQEATGTFYLILIASAIPALGSTALKNHADALDRPWIPFSIFFGGVLINIFLNWVMIFGNLGCPALGFEGAAWGTLIARVGMLLGVWLWLSFSKDLREWVPHHWLRKPDFVRIRHLLAIGIPASLQILTEVSAFSVAGLLMGHISADAMAAHQITISLTGVAFMIPLGFSMALSVRVGQVNGSGDRARLRQVAFSGWMCLSVIAVINASCFLTLGREMASWFTDASRLIQLSAALLAICGVFQIFDALQVGSASMLRGLHDTRIPAVIGAIAYWVVGIPFGAWLAFEQGMGARGVWWGLAAGLFIACSCMGVRMWRMVKSSRAAMPQPRG